MVRWSKRCLPQMTISLYTNLNIYISIYSYYWRLTEMIPGVAMFWMTPHVYIYIHMYQLHICKSLYMFCPKCVFPWCTGCTHWCCFSRHIWGWMVEATYQHCLEVDYHWQIQGTPETKKNIEKELWASGCNQTLYDVLYDWWLQVDEWNWENQDRNSK